MGALERWETSITDSQAVKDRKRVSARGTKSSSSLLLWGYCLLNQCFRANSEYSVSVQNSENTRNTWTCQDFNIESFLKLIFLLALSFTVFNFAVPIICLLPQQLEEILKRKCEGGKKPPLHFLPQGARTWWRRNTFTVSIFAIRWCKPAVSAGDIPFIFHMVKQHILAVWCHHFTARMTIFTANYFLRRAMWIQ